MKSRSPLYSVDKIKIPVLIAQGGNDVRVTPQESEQIVSAMKARNLYVDYLYFPDAGHGFNTTEDSVRFYTEAENFLSAYIGGRVEVAVSGQ
jgi:dipeptidyl aminopeptidase/acylaminoacyl peptidase